MRKVLLALVFATVGITTLGASADPAAAWRSYRWYRDYAPLYPQAYYGPPRVYVVPPAYARYPAPLYRYCPPGYVIGPQGDVFPRRYSYPREVRRYPRGYWRARRWRR